MNADEKKALAATTSLSELEKSENSGKGNGFLSPDEVETDLAISDAEKEIQEGAKLTNARKSFKALRKKHFK